MRTNSFRFAFGLLLLMLAGSFSAQGADPGNEQANQEICTGTCSTCPGKAQALAELADKAKVTLAVEGLSTAEEAQRIRGALAELAGVESCVAFAEQAWVWVAYDKQRLSIVQLTKQLDALGFKVAAEVQRIDPLAAPAKGLERTSLYVLLPQDPAKLAAALDKAAQLAGVAQLRYDRAFNLLLADLDPAQSSASKLKQSLIKAGFAAGLPGEELTQPR
jgi:copper chaperone CopZ